MAAIELSSNQCSSSSVIVSDNYVEECRKRPTEQLAATSQRSSARKGKSSLAKKKRIPSEDKQDERLTSTCDLDSSLNSDSEGSGDGEVRCFCNDFREFGEMVECEVCSGWFHFMCLSMSIFICKYVFILRHLRCVHAYVCICTC